MADANKIKLAKETYKTLLKAIDMNGWKCAKNDEDLSISFGVNGDDLHMDFLVKVDTDRQLVRLLSKLPFKFKTEKFLEGAIVTSVANYSLADGSFDYDILDGTIIFRMTTSYRSSLIAPEALVYLVNCATFTVDEYNDQFLMVANGAMSVKQFIEKHN